MRLKDISDHTVIVAERLKVMSVGYWLHIGQTSKLGSDVKYVLGLSAGFYVFVALFEASLPILSQMTIDGLTGDKKVTSISAGLGLVLIYWFALAFKDTLLEFGLSIYNIMVLRPVIYRKISHLTFNLLREEGKRRNGEIRKKLQPTVQVGRSSWVILVEYPLREVPVILIGLFAYVQLFYQHGLLFMIAVIGVIASIAVTMLKDHYLSPLYDQRQDKEFDQFSYEQRAESGKSVDVPMFRNYLDAFVESDIDVQAKAAMWDNMARDGVFALTILTGFVVTLIMKDGEAGLTAGQLVMIMSLLDQSRRPANAVFNMQRELQFRRRSRDDLAKLLNV